MTCKYIEAESHLTISVFTGGYWLEDWLVKPLPIWTIDIISPEKISWQYRHFVVFKVKSWLYPSREYTSHFGLFGEMDKMEIKQF